MSINSHMRRLFWRTRMFLWWLSSQESTREHRSCRFDHWVGKIPWRRKWQSTPVFLLGIPMDIEALWATILKVTREWDTI